MENFNPRQGAFAFCSRNELGLITSETAVPVFYRYCKACQARSDDGLSTYSNCTDCERGIAWTGISLEPEKFGQPWSSRNPRVVGEIRKSAHERRLYVVDGRHFSRAMLEL